MYVMTSTSQAFNFSDCKKNEIIVFLTMSGNAKVNATNLNGCEMVFQESAVGWETGNYQRSGLIIKCNQQNVSFTISMGVGATANYSYYIRLS